MRAWVLMMVLMPASALAVVVARPITYSVGTTEYESVLLFDDAVKGPRPGLVAVPNWMGVTPANVKQIGEIAGPGYVVLVADVYGKGVRPTGPEQAGKFAGGLKADRARLRERVAEALEVLRAQVKSAPLDPARIGAIGFCFGGTSVLELVRSGAKVAGVVTFHGGLDSPTPADGSNITAKVLALHGADDPTIPAKDLEAFEDEMRAAKVDWQLVKYGNTVHSFTDPDANTPGRSQYNPVSARRAREAMEAFFAELGFGPGSAKSKTTSSP